MTNRFVCRLGAAVVFAGALSVANSPAQVSKDTVREAGRDPTQPPPEYALPLRGERLLPDVIDPKHLVVVNGVRYLIWKSRWLAVGDSIDGARLERISETEVWVRNAAGLRKLPIFTGIEKRPPDSGASINSSVPSRADGKKGTTK